ncbi:MAG: hypothetical protein A2901_05175 [Elusimicrobia bacterium RIFCSPLOWO2_01_FULL_54_10]|nr:MAG: hypothetical protein A2901_05175 [Elusimicrobia bacterium RIFCSPLOWO2_01_FULL_54_10]
MLKIINRWQLWGILCLFSLIALGFSESNEKSTVQKDLESSALNFGGSHNILYVVVSPEGKKTGHLTSSKYLKEIPNSVSVRNFIENTVTGKLEGGSQIVELYQPSSGTYSLNILGLETGPFNIGISGFSEKGVPTEFVKLSGKIVKNAKHNMKVQFDPKTGIAKVLGNGSIHINTKKIGR